MPTDNKIVQEAKTSQIRERVRALKKQGKDIVNLAAGELIDNLPAEIRVAANRAVNEGCNLYTDTAGIRELRELIASRSPLLSQKGSQKGSQQDFAPEQVVITSGAKTAIFQTMLALLNPGDEVIIPTPVWSTFSAQVQLIGAKVRDVKCREPDYDLDADAIAAAITPKTRMIILNTPCNPTGRIWSDDAIDTITKLALEHDIWILWDACYAEIIFDGRAIPSPFRINPAVKDKTLVIGSFSKAYAIAGWRLGYAIAPVHIAKTISAIQSRTTSNANALAQQTLIHVLSKNNDITSRITAHVRGNRDLAWPRLSQIPVLRAVKPDGGFYIYCDIDPEEYAAARAQTIDDIDDVILDLIEHAGVALTPGSAFNVARGARLSLSLPRADLEAGLTRLENLFSGAARQIK